MHQLVFFASDHVSLQKEWIVDIPTFARKDNILRAISALVPVMQVACCILCSVMLFHSRIPRISLEINAACVRLSWKRFLFGTRAIVNFKRSSGSWIWVNSKSLKETILVTPTSKWEKVNIECSFSVFFFYFSFYFLFTFFIDFLKHSVLKIISRVLSWGCFLVLPRWTTFISAWPGQTLNAIYNLFSARDMTSTLVLFILEKFTPRFAWSQIEFLEKRGSVLMKSSFGAALTLTRLYFLKESIL